MRYFLKLSYNGGAFHGWQAQPNASSVQQTIEEALATVLRRPAPVTGAGRTDTGVNARVMYAHFDSPEPVIDRGRLITALNRLCGRHISIEDVFGVADDAHARFDAVEREYRYFVTFRKTPFLPFSWFCQTDLDLERMNEAGKILTATSDFTSFAKLHTDVKTNICDVREACWTQWENEYGVPGIEFRIRADRFLRNMVRAIVGTIVDVGRGKIDLDGFRDIIDKKDRCAAGTSMPAQALFLWDISYPSSILKR